MNSNPYRDEQVWAWLLGGAAALVAILYLFSCCGCAGSFGPPSAATTDIVYCRRLDEAHATWGAVGKGTVVLSSGAGLTTLPIDHDQKTLRLSLAATSLGLAALSVASLYASDSAADSWARDCGQSMPTAGRE